MRISMTVLQSHSQRRRTVLHSELHHSIAELKSRRERFLRELLISCGLPALSVDSPPLPPGTPSSTCSLHHPQHSGGTAFPGLLALLFQQEHMVRAPEIPFCSFRSDTLMSYLFGIREPLCPHSDGSKPGGHATCALVYVKPTIVPSPTRMGMHTNEPNTDPPPRSWHPLLFSASVDVFVSPISADTLSWQGHSATHGGPSRAFGELFGAESQSEVSLLTPHDGVVTQQCATSEPIQIVHRLWEVLHDACCVTSSAEWKRFQDEESLHVTTSPRRAALQVKRGGSTKLAIHESQQLPHFFVSLPTQRHIRSCPTVSMESFASDVLRALGVPCSGTTSVETVVSGGLHGGLPHANTLDPREYDALRRLSLTHPVSTVLAGLLCYRKYHAVSWGDREGYEDSIIPCGPVVEPEPRSWRPVAVSQYVLSGAEQWGLQPSWPCIPPTAFTRSTPSAEASFASVAELHAPIARAVTQDGASLAPETEGDARKMINNNSNRVQCIRKGLHNARLIFDKIRCIKTPHDVALFYRGAYASRRIFAAGMNHSRTDGSEWGIFNAMRLAGSLHSNKVGSSCPAVFAYPPVVAVGKHAVVLHHTHYDGVGTDGDWILVDGGIETADVYLTDCSRTWPVLVQEASKEEENNPKRVVFETLLAAQRHMIQSMRPSMSTKQLSRVALQLLKEAILHISHSMTPGTSALGNQGVRSCSDGLVSMLTAHSVGHFVGFDIHERGPPAPRSSSTQKSAARQQAPKPTNDGSAQTNHLPTKSSPSAIKMIGHHHADDDDSDTTPPLLPGTIHTIEPGLYFRDGEDEGALTVLLEANKVSREEYRTVVPACLGTFGLRIEDMVLMLPKEGETTITGHTRKQYLDALVQAHMDMHQHPTREASEAHFLEEQTHAIFGNKPLTEHVGSGQVGRKAVGGGDYQLDVVVLTACIPKDLPDMTRVGRGGGGGSE